MSNEAQELLARALELPVNERARLAADLLDSLDDDEESDSPEEVQKAWGEEIERRVAAARRGESGAVDWPTARAELEKEYLRR